MIWRYVGLAALIVAAIWLKSKFLRVLNWFLFTLFLAAFPLGFRVLLRWMCDKLLIDPGVDAPEMLLFSMIMCAGALGRIFTADGWITWGAGVLSFSKSMLTIGCLISAALYGTLAYIDVTGTACPHGFDAKAVSLGVTIGISVVCLAFSAELVVIRFEDTRDKRQQQG